MKKATSVFDTKLKQYNLDQMSDNQKQNRRHNLLNEILSNRVLYDKEVLNLTIDSVAESSSSTIKKI